MCICVPAHFVHMVQQNNLVSATTLIPSGSWEPFLLTCVPCASVPAHARCACGPAMQFSHPLKLALTGHTAGMQVCAHGQAGQSL